MVAAAALIIVALALRLPLLAGLPTAFTAGEGERLAAALALAAGQWPAALGSPGPGLSLYVEGASLRLLGFDAVAARLPAALAGVGAVVAFYLLSRTLYRPLPTLAVSLLYATEVWALATSRSAYGYVWAQLLALLAAWAVARALADAHPLRWWALAGALGGLTAFESAGGRWLVVALLLYTSIQVYRRPKAGQRSVLLGALLALVAGAIICVIWVLPYPAGPLAGLSAAFGGSAVDGGEVQSLAVRLANVVRALALVDGAAVVDSPLLPAGRALFGAVPGLLVLGGLYLSLRQRSQAMPAGLLFVPLLASAFLTAAAVDVGDVAVALPFAYLFAATGLEWLLALPSARFGSAQLLVLALVGLSALLNVADYVRWQTDPRAAQARQPALLAVELPVWAEAQLSARQSGNAGLSVAEWQRARGRYLPTPVPGPTPTAARPTPAPVVPLAISLLLRLGQAGELTAPRAVAVVPNGDILVADSAAKRVLRYSGQGNLLGELPGQFAEPFDLAVSPAGEVYVLDSDLGTVFKFDPAGNLTGVVGGGLGTYKPRGLGLDGQGRLYIADTGRDRVLVLGPDGKLLRQIDKTQTPFQQPTDVAVDGTGNLYVAVPMEGRLLKFDANGRYLGDWGLTVTNTIDAPHPAFTPDGVLVVSDPGQRRVLLLSSDGLPVGALAPGGEGLLRLPVGVTSDGLGNIFVADKGDASVKKYGRAD